MLQEIAKDEAKEAISAAGVERFVEASACSVDTRLAVKVSSVAATRACGCKRLTSSSRPSSVTQTRSTRWISASKASPSNKEASWEVSTVTSGLRLSILAFAASTLCGAHRQSKGRREVREDLSTLAASEHGPEVQSTALSADRTVPCGMWTQE